MISLSRRQIAGSILVSLFGMMCTFVVAIRIIHRRHLQLQVFHAISALTEGAIYGGDGTTIFQHHSNDCGAAALLMVLEARGIHEDFGDLEASIALSQQGASLLQLRKAAEARGARAVSWSLTMHDLRNAPLPAILFIHSNHYVEVVRFVNPYLVEIHDPALGKLYFPTPALERAWSGESLIFSAHWLPSS